jgi:2-dehydropantoate 2-reductase
MKFAIFGTGGVGGYFGGRLAQAGNDVTFIARGAHLAAIQASGLRVESISGDFTIHPASVTDLPQSIGVVDVVILTTKAWQLSEAMEQLQPLLGTDTVILPLLNGMEHMDVLRERFGKHLIGGLCRISVFIGAPGLIKHVGVPPYIAFGELDNSKRGQVESLHKIFAALQGVTAEVPADITAAMWEKFIFISGTSGIGALTRKPVGDYRVNPESRAMLIAAMEETAAVARARGANISSAFVDETIQRIDNLPPQMLASMQKDMMEGRPSELNEQTGAVIRMGKSVNVPTPTHEKIYAELLPLEQKVRSR